jgi:hypothetical protein
MNISPILDAMKVAGATSEVLLAAVKAFEDEAEKLKILKRHKDALRKRKSRMSHDVTVTSRDSDGHDVTSSPPLVPPLNGFPDPSLIPPYNPPHSDLVEFHSPRPPKEKTNRGTRLSQEWDLPQEWGDWAEQQGMTPEAIIRECDKFKDFWIAKSGAGGTKNNWEATWRNWIRRHLEDYAK